MSNDRIMEKLRSGELVFSPRIDQFQLQQHSVDLRLGFTFLVPKSWELSDEGRIAVITDHLDFMHNREQFTVIELEEGQFFDILPGEYVAVTTLESVKLPNSIMAVLYPRSSVNRRGLSVDLTGIVDAGYEGNLLIPIRNNTQYQVIRMYPGERFCQLVFEEIGDKLEIQQSRWHKKDVIITSQAERSSEETEYVRSGRVTELKQSYSMEALD